MRGSKETSSSSSQNVQDTQSASVLLGNALISGNQQYRYVNYKLMQSLEDVGMANGTLKKSN
jgi:hypothetical protein